MYVKPFIYRIYSILRLISGVFGFLSLVASGIIYACIGTFDSIFSFSLKEYLPIDFGFDFSTSAWIISGIMFLCALLLLFFSYMEFSSLFQFADLINHEQKGGDQPIRKRAFVLPPKAYRNFGITIFSIYFVLSTIAVIVLIISQSITNRTFVAVPLIPIGLIAYDLVVIYITCFMKYKAFGDALEIATEKDQNNPSAIIKESLKENKTGVLRAWCVFLFVCCIIITVLSIVGIILIFFYLPRELHLILIISIISAWITTILTNAVIGCYFDNLAMMIERKLIRYNLINNANKSVKCSNCKANVPGDASYCASCGTKINR